LVKSNTDSSSIIELTNVSKIYQTYSSPQHRMIELLTAGRKRYAREVRALDDVSLTLERGSRLGIVGENGSGKSTLLKVLSGVLMPSSGIVRVNGRISALLELGAGFNPELPGRENIRQFCMLHGMTRGEIDEAVPDIIQFSELRDAIDHPVKTYSSGMAVRLGFACAVYVEPEILIVDEALSVGDAYFQNKCLHKIKSLLDRGTTFIYVTHAADSIRSLCQQGIWMDKGRVRLSGPSAAVGAEYQKDIFRRMVQSGLKDSADVGRAGTAIQVDQTTGAQQARHTAFAERVGPLRTGSGEARIVDIVLLDQHGVDTDRVVFNTKCKVQVFYRAEQPLSVDYGITLGIADTSGCQIMHFNSAQAGIYITADNPQALKVIEFEFVSPLCPGEYGLMAGIASFVLSPVNRGQLMLDKVVDYCVGGARYSILYPDSDQEHNLWGVAYASCEISTQTLA
jgi:lipopolysaccharide transport system ATP-binding protein